VPLAGTAALDIGYDRAWSDHAAWGVRVRCAKTGFAHEDDDVATSLGTTELGLAIRLSAF
jgi:hypothetical protein